MKKEAIRMITALTAVAILSGLSLVFVYRYAMPKIEVNVKNETKSAIENIFPDGADIKPVKGDENMFSVKGKSGKMLGYAIIAEGNGYQGTIKMVAGVDETFKVMSGMEVLESQETPGLGAEIAGKPFAGQFSGLAITHEIEYVKNQKPAQPYQIEAITGATISSRAVVNILNESIDKARRAAGGGK
ncbi:MAG: FMN-binding protein [Candidatus Omnitrophica bacterium]|nr:FMN-binding protein [Candidatus Omnitrophota bacterium]MBU1128033.1 FMN-binding protein [Candidatus Omnitrophota bacterium]MBU1851129.1 FMN-binding protein [Candidatus Omnitrophota bacterium]